MALRVVTWPMGYIIVAKNRQMLFFAAELAWTVVNVGLSWLCVRPSASSAPASPSSAPTSSMRAMVYPSRAASAASAGARLTRALRGPLWSRAPVFVALDALPAPTGVALGLLLTLASIHYCARRLCQLLPQHRLPPPLLWLLNLKEARP